MKQYKKYLVGSTEEFDPAGYDSISEEVSLINETTKNTPVDYKGDIIISFLKDHSLENKWIDANPELINLVKMQTFFTGRIESLFDSCRDNPVFRQGLEDYLKKEFS